MKSKFLNVTKINEQSIKISLKVSSFSGSENISCLCFNSRLNGGYYYKQVDKKVASAVADATNVLHSFIQTYLEYAPLRIFSISSADVSLGLNLHIPWSNAACATFFRSASLTPSSFKVF